MQNIIVKNLGLKEYLPTWEAMSQFTDERDANTLDEIWLVEHPAVFTQGQAGKAEHILNAGDIPIIQTDRGGQVTYHGPGQLVAYVLIDLRRSKMGVRDLVSTLERSTIEFLKSHQLEARARPDAPGVYLDNAKICSVGLRVRRGCSYHGLAFNINMDLEPFSRINPCGLTDITVTQLSEHIGPIQLSDISSQFQEVLLNKLSLIKP